MTVSWVIERYAFDDDYVTQMSAHLKRTGRPLWLVEVDAADHTVVGRAPAPDGACVVYGSIGIHKVANRYGWTPGAFSDEAAFRGERYADALADLSLNREITAIPLRDVPPFLLGAGLEEAFIKPDDDNKAFAGGVFKTSELADWIERMISIGYFDDADFSVIVAPPQVLNREWRNVVVDGATVASSLYRQGGERVLSAGAPATVTETVARAHQRFAPAPVYVVDIAETTNGLKVVEYNTFNSAELYACDLDAVIDAVSTYVDRETPPS